MGKDEGTGRDKAAGWAHRFDHEKLDVYAAALEFTAWRRGLVRRLPRGNADLTDQLTRAGHSIALNIAEGSGEFSAADKARFFRMARRSATECAAALDLIRREHLLPIEVLDADAFGGQPLGARGVASTSAPFT